MTHLQAGLSPDTIEKARLELNENPDILHQDIQQVRDMIITRPDIGFLRTDDAFILRFLRARKFHQADAFRLLAQYFQYRQLNLDMFKNFKADDPGIKRALIDGFPGVLENRDHYGRKILLLFAMPFKRTSGLSFRCLMPLFFLRISEVQGGFTIIGYFLVDKSRQDHLALEKYTNVSTQSA